MARLVCWLHAWDARAWAQANRERLLYLLAWGALCGREGRPCRQPCESQSHCTEEEGAPPATLRPARPTRPACKPRPPPAAAPRAAGLHVGGHPRLRGAAEAGHRLQHDPALLLCPGAQLGRFALLWLRFSLAGTVVSGWMSLPSRAIAGQNLGCESWLACKAEACRNKHRLGEEGGVLLCGAGRCVRRRGRNAHLALCGPHPGLVQGAQEAGLHAGGGGEAGRGSPELGCTMGKGRRTVEREAACSSGDGTGCSDSLQGGLGSPPAAALV